MAKESKKAAEKAAKKSKPKSESAAEETELMRPLMSLRDQIEDMFDRYAHGWSGHWPRLGQLWDVEPGLGLKGFGRTPIVDMSETDRGYEITAELPGLDEEDVEVNVTDDVLTISGEKREEHEEKKKDYFMQERRFGQFRRSLRLPQDADSSKISARFKKGVLSVEVPKSSGAAEKKGRKISVSKA